MILTSGWNDGCLFEALGINASNSQGTGVSNAGWTSFGAASFEYNSMLFITNGSATQSLTYDIGVGSAGSQFVVVDGLYNPSTKAANQGMGFALPIRIKSGSTVWVRSSSGTATRASLYGASGRLPGFSTCQRIVGVPSTSGIGVSIDPGGVANTKDGWTELTSGLSDHAIGMAVIVGENGDAVRTAAGYLALDIGVGGAGSERILIPDLLVGWGTTLDVPQPQQHGPFPCDIPAGTRISARAQSTNTTAGDRTVDVRLLMFLQS